VPYRSRKNESTSREVIWYKMQKKWVSESNNNNKYKKEKTCTLIDVVTPSDRNVVQKEGEKKLQYKSLCIEMQRMWNLK